MFKIGLIILLFFTAGESYAQQGYFVLIKTDNNQPFYARVEGRSFSSSMQGHLIIPQLSDSTYTITIGFPKKLFPEQDFTITVNKNDLGFQLKDLGEKGWGLFDMHSLELKMPVRIDTSGTAFRPEGVKKDDAFSRLMAGVVSDTAVMYNTYSAETAGKNDSALRPAPAPQTPGSQPVSSQGIVSQPTTFQPPVTSPASTLPTPGSQAPSQIPGSQNPGTQPPGSQPAVSQPSGSQAHIPQTPVSQPPGAQTASSQPLKTDSSADTPSSRTGIAADSLFRSTPPSMTYAGKKDSLTTPAGTGVPGSAGTKGNTSPPSVTTGAGTSPGSGMPVTTGSPAGSAGGVVPKAANRHKGVFVEKLGEQRTASTLKVTYADHAKGRPTDTVIIVIPIDSGGLQTSLGKTTDTAKKGPGSSVPPVLAANDLPKSSADPSSKSKKAPPAVVNSDCKSFAADYDVDKLRLKLLAAPKDEDKMLIAKKVFRTKCFSSPQIRTLCEVFMADAGKFRFLEAAYPFVWDDRFRDLLSILGDPSYISRFRTMTGQ